MVNTVVHVSSAKRGKRCVKSRKCKWANAAKYPGQCVPLDELQSKPCSQKHYMNNIVRLAVHKSRKKRQNCGAGFKRCKYFNNGCIKKKSACSKKAWDMYNQFEGVSGNRNDSYDKLSSFRWKNRRSLTK